MPRGATCSPMSKSPTIGNGDTPPSATSPLNRQRQKRHNPVSTFPGEGQNPLHRLKATLIDYVNKVPHCTSDNIAPDLGKALRCTWNRISVPELVWLYS